MSKETGEGKAMGYVCRIIAVFLIILIIAGIILGYFVHYMGNDGQVHDGFGRLLDTVPGGLSLILPQWAGYIWFIIDCLIILALIVAIDRLFVQSKIYFTGVKDVDF
ncbi:MAG: hypothetical protein FWD71_17335 [Oscillospiraceae bacterium]|nr:hypothetical protein [Oscillospiraceae bacterium]